ELLVDLLAGGEQEPEVGVPGRLHWLVALGEADELMRLLGHEDVGHLTDALGVDAGPAEHVPVEGVDLFAELGGERPARERQLHVVEPHLRHECPRSSLRTGGEESLRCASWPIACAQSTWIFWTRRRIASCSKRLSPHQRRQCSP